MVSHPELGLDPPIGSDRESGYDNLLLYICYCYMLTVNKY